MPRQKTMVVEKRSLPILPIILTFALTLLYASIAFFFSVQAQQSALEDREAELETATIDLSTNTVYSEAGKDLRMDLQGEAYADYVFTDTLMSLAVPGIGVLLLVAAFFVIRSLSHRGERSRVESVDNHPAPAHTSGS